MKLSFVVVAFEHPSALRTCLSSLLDQSMRDFEIIVVDNSVDCPWLDLNQDECCASPRIHYEWTADRTSDVPPDCRHKRCLYTATEIGVARATGDFICMPNQDSYYVPVFAERMIRAAEATHCDLLYSDFIHETPSHKYIAMESESRVYKIDKTSFILRRESFIGFPDKKTHYEIADGLMIERLVAAGITRKHVPEVLCAHN